MYFIDDIKQRGILIVDDEETMTWFLEKTIKGAGFKKLYIANNGIKALNILTSYGPEIYLVVLDVRMPGMSGLEVIEHLSNVHTYHVGIILITAYGSTDVASQFFRLGSEKVLTLEYMEKPFEFNDLKSEIEKTLELIHNKRKKFLDISGEKVFVKLLKIEEKMDYLNLLPDIKKEVTKITKKQNNFFTQLGLDIVRIILIAIAFLSLLYFGVGDFLKSLINK